MEYNNVRDALEELLEENDHQTCPDIQIKESGAPARKATFKDLQEINYELLTNIADILGMEDLYLKTPHKKNRY